MRYIGNRVSVDKCIESPVASYSTEAMATARELTTPVKPCWRSCTISKPITVHQHVPHHTMHSCSLLAAAALAGCCRAIKYSPKRSDCCLHCRCQATAIVSSLACSVKQPHASPTSKADCVGSACFECMAHAVPHLVTLPTKDY